MPFNLGPMEMILVMVVLLLLFGAKRLPELGQGLGRGIREFKRSVSDISGESAASGERGSIARTGAAPVLAGRSSSKESVEAACLVAAPAVEADRPA